MTNNFKNKVYIADCQSILKKIDDNKIDLCITDPPYNYEFIGKNWNNKEINRRIKKLNDWMNEVTIKYPPIKQT